MICLSYRCVLLARVPYRSLRFASTISATSNAASTSPPSTNEATPVTSSATPGISQPFSTDELPSTSSANSANSVKTNKKAMPQSSIAGGQELKGLAYLKAVSQVLAKEDGEYPEWLWSLLDKPRTEGQAAVDLTALTKKQRMKVERKQARLLRDMPKAVPVHEQSRDLTEEGADAITSLQKRQEITRSARIARRKAIVESNFLKGV